MYRRMAIAMLAAMALAFTSIGLSATPAEAGWVEGWYTFYGNATKAKVFHERSPLKTKFVLKLQQKRGASSPCRAKVIVDKGRWIGSTEWYVKETRGNWDWHAGFWDWEGDKTKRTKAKVKTNGNCQYRIWFK